MGDVPDQSTLTGVYPAGGEFAAPNVRNWASEIDPKTLDQAAASAKLPILAGPVALMPDAHFGYGVTVGSVIATDGAIIPSAVGVDVGCGMAAVRTDLRAEDLPDNLSPLLKLVEKHVPAGVGNSHASSTKFADNWFKEWGMPQHFDQKQRERALNQFGTLGSGNHFAEISLDEEGNVWVVLHSGSRGIGNEIATNHIKQAGRDFGNVVTGEHYDPDLAWLVQGTEPFRAYTTDLNWLQAYAFGNRDAMLAAMTHHFFNFVGKGSAVDIINCHHNYAAEETHEIDGELKKVWVTRKGAIRALEGDRGIIPGSMGTSTYIVEGLGNPLSWGSCSHGAGRRMSRAQAKKRLTIASLNEKMAGRTWLDDRPQSLLDEHPDAYKDIEAVIADQSDLARILYKLDAILNYKG